MSTTFITPLGYNDNDYQKLVKFLEIEDIHGIKNGERMSKKYNPYKPNT